LYCSPNIIVPNPERMMVGYVACKGEEIDAYKVLVRKAEGRGHFGGMACMG
jgi:hypothetical protein